ncbi:unnamed protein product [Caenorhabditis brenneri]
MTAVSNSAPPPIANLLKLPLLQVQNIVRRCDPAEIIASTFLFDAMNELMKKAKLIATDLTYIHKEGVHSLHIDFGHNKGSINIRTGTLDDENDLPPTKINGIELKISRTVTGNSREWIIRRPDGFDQEMVLGEMMNHLLQVIKFKNLCFSTSSDLPNLRELPIFQHGTDIGLIQIKKRNQRSVIFTADHLNFLLDEINAKELDLKVKVRKVGDTDFFYEKPFKAQKIELHNVSWVTTKCFLGGDIISVKLDGETKKEIDYNAIVKYWLNGGHPNLDRFVAQFTNAAVNFGDIKMTPTIFKEDDFSRRNISSYLGSLNDIIKDGKDIRRTTDGLLATLFATTEQVLWCVWHEKYHMFCVPDTFKKLKEVLKITDY